MSQYIILQCVQYGRIGTGGDLLICYYTAQYI